MNERVDVNDLRSLFDHDPKTGRIWRISDQSEVGSVRQSDGYIRFCVSRKTVMAHRAIWALSYGDWPRSFIDHIDGCRQNNRLDNLREVSPADSSKNLGVYRTNNSGFPGVYFCKGRGLWVARIKMQKKRINLGRFANLDDAIAARAKAQVLAGYHKNHGYRESWRHEN